MCRITGKVGKLLGRYLAPGEYAVVLRPISKGKKFSGAEVVQNQGPGLLFNSAWSFTVK